SLGFLTSSGLIDTMLRGSEEILVVRENKRLALDFYKNNLIHAFVVPSLATHGINVGKRGPELVDEVWNWLDLFRYEFALPQREELAPLVKRFFDYAQEIGAISDAGIEPAHPLTRATISMLENFREAYWIAARTIRDLVGEDGISEKSLIEEQRKNYSASLLLGEAQRPEGATVVPFKNALSRFSELGFIKMKSGGRGRRERKITRGPNAAALDAFVEKLRRGVLGGRLPEGPL